MSRIVTKSSSTVFFLELLETIVKDCPEELEDHLPKIKESLDYLSFLSLATAIRLMAALKDVAKTNRSFRDGLILILRKALFSK
jgi:Fanconi anemia group I protein